MSTVFISGATGYLGRPLCQSLVSSGWDVHALARPQSIRKVPLGCAPIPGDALNPATFRNSVPTATTFIHLTGVAHPSPAKTAAFRAIDQASFEASLQAAIAARASHFIYVSVAHPAPVMHDYIAVRRVCEQRLRDSGLNATISVTYGNECAGGTAFTKTFTGQIVISNNGGNDFTSPTATFSLTGTAPYAAAGLRVSAVLGPDGRPAPEDAAQFTCILVPAGVVR